MKFASGRRHELILEALAATRFVTVTELAKRLDVSEMTIRRDLERLDTNGKLKRTHGGATVLKTGGQSKVDILETLGTFKVIFNENIIEFENLNEMKLFIKEKLKASCYYIDKIIFSNNPHSI